MGSKKVTDYDILKKHYTFLNDQNDESWESNLVSSYHESLFKEYVVCDLSRYKTGDIGLRWRTAQEVVDGKCENICANSSCQETSNLTSYEAMFNYIEHKQKKQFQALENDLSLVEEKLKNELRCVYDVEVFDISENVANTRIKVSKLHQSLKDLYSQKNQLFQLVNKQLQVLDSLGEFEELKGTVFTDDSKDIIDFSKSIRDMCISYFNPCDVEEVKELFKSKNLVSKDEKTNKKKFEFVPVNETQFNSVPILVRRRATLGQVNELLEYLYKEALKRNRCVPISISEISNKGIKVFGQTGSSKIAILRFLKIIEVINRDNTILLIDPRIKKNNLKNKM